PPPTRPRTARRGGAAAARKRKAELHPLPPRRHAAGHGGGRVAILVVLHRRSLPRGPRRHRGRDHLGGADRRLRGSRAARGPRLPLPRGPRRTRRRRLGPPRSPRAVTGVTLSAAPGPGGGGPRTRREDAAESAPSGKREEGGAHEAGVVAQR